MWMSSVQNQQQQKKSGFFIVFMFWLKWSKKKLIAFITILGTSKTYNQKIKIKKTQERKKIQETDRL